MNQAKSYTITLENRGEYLYALVGGEKLTAEISKQYWDEIAAECIRLDVMKILIEKDFAQTVPVGEMLEMGNYVSKYFANKKIAFYDRYGHTDINNFGQKVAENRGVEMKIFDNIKDAEEWLITN